MLRRDQLCHVEHCQVQYDYAHEQSTERSKLSPELVLASESESDVVAVEVQLEALVPEGRILIVEVALLSQFLLNPPSLITLVHLTALSL